MSDLIWVVVVLAAYGAVLLVLSLILRRVARQTGRFSHQFEVRVGGGRSEFDIDPTDPPLVVDRKIRDAVAVALRGRKGRVASRSAGPKSA